MQVTRAADYGIRVLVHLSSLPTGSRASLPDLSDAVEAPAAFLSKVLQRLVKAGLVTSCRGKQGGFELSRRPNAISLLDILHALDSVPWLNTCVKPTDDCHRRPTCGAHLVWLEAQERLHEVLSDASLERIARLSHARQRLSANPQIS